MPRAQVIVDCDPGHDDVMAILAAARYADLLGVTTVAGNAGLEHTTRNALVTRELAGLAVEVHAGAAGPLAGPLRDGALVHGPTGLAGVDPPPPIRAPDGHDGPGYLVETARAHPGCWIVGVGPLTNVALALQRAPDLTERLAGISIMGGGTFGNVTPVAEFNLWADPDAAAIVFGSGVPLRMCGLDLTHQVGVDERLVARLRGLGTALGEFTAQMLDHYRATILALAAREVAALHDPCAVLAITHPELFEFGQHAVAVETRGEHTRGMTVIDRRSWSRGPCEVAWRVDVDRAFDLVVDAVAARCSGNGDGIGDNGGSVHPRPGPP